MIAVPLFVALVVLATAIPLGHTLHPPTRKAHR